MRHGRGEPSVSEGVIYFAVGSGIAPLITVSIHTLRNYYVGPVCIIAADELGEGLARLIGSDERLGDVSVKRWHVSLGRGKGKKHSAKAHLIEQMPYDRAVFLDADTIVVGEFSELFPKHGYVYLTSFSSWTSNTRPTKRRLERFKDSHPKDYAVCMANPLPSINTGTMGLSKHAVGFSKEWREACDANPCFQADELVANLIFWRYPHNVLDTRYNWSPTKCGDREREKYGEPIIYHLHGYKPRCWDPESAQRKHEMKDLWLPYRDRAIEENIARMGEWYPDQKKLLEMLP